MTSILTWRLLLSIDTASRFYVKNKPHTGFQPVWGLGSLISYDTGYKYPR